MRAADRGFACALALAIMVSLACVPGALAASNINVTGRIDAARFFQAGNSTLTNSITGSAGNLSCVGCLDTTQISHVYLLNTGDTGSGQYVFSSTGSPGVRIGDLSTGFLQVGGSTISDAGGSLTLDSDTASTNIVDDLDSGAVPRITLGNTILVSGNLNAIGNFSVNASASLTPLLVTSDINNYAQLKIKNVNGGTAASGDLVVEANNGDESDYFLDCGVNSNGFSLSSWTINGRNDGYCYAQNGSFWIGTATPGTNLTFGAGGTLAGNETMRITSDGKVGIGTTTPTQKLDVAGSVNASGNVYDNGNRVCTASNGLCGGGNMSMFTLSANGNTSQVLNATTINLKNGTGVAFTLTVGPAGTVNLSANLNTTGVNTATCGSATQVCAVRFDAQGRATSATNTTITFAYQSAAAGWANTTTLVTLASNATNVSIGNTTGNTPVLFVDSKNGRVGINTSTPANSLNVVGDLNVTGRAYGVAPTMYMNLTASAGAHNCDNTAGGGCCAFGYHMCTAPEVISGGRQVETTGTNRYTTPYNTDGFVDPVGGSFDCTDWTSTSGAAYVCRYNTTIACSEGGNCGVATRLWCCSD